MEKIYKSLWIHQVLCSMVTFLRRTRVPFFVGISPELWMIIGKSMSLQFRSTRFWPLLRYGCLLFVVCWCLLFVVCCLLLVVFFFVCLFVCLFVCCLLGSVNSPLPELAPPRICVWCRLGARTTSPLFRFSSSVDCKNFGGVTIVQKN